MRFSVLLILLLSLVPSIVVAEVYGTSNGVGYFQTMSADNFFSEFLSNYYAEITSLSIAVVAAIGLQMAFKRYGGFDDDKSINTLTVSVFIAMFLMIYSSGMYVYFIPFIGYLFLTGIGVLIWGVYRGLSKAKMEPVDKLVAAAGSFFLSWFAYKIGLFFAGIILGVFGFLLLLYALPSLDKLGFGSRKRKLSSEDDDEVIDDEGFDEAADKVEDRVTADNFDDYVNEVHDLIKDFTGELNEAQASLIKALKELKP